VEVTNRVGTPDYPALRRQLSCFGIDDLTADEEDQCVSILDGARRFVVGWRRADRAFLGPGEAVNASALRPLLGTNDVPGHREIGETPGT